MSSAARICGKSFRSEFVDSQFYKSNKRKRNTGAAASFIGMMFCGQCGTKIGAMKICPKCKKKNALNMQFCGYCGARLK